MKQNLRYKFLLSTSLIIFSLGLTACTSSPSKNYERPSVETPAWNMEASISDRQIAKEWWKEFQDDQLNQLMDKALTSNHDLKAAMARIEQARAALKISGSPLQPTASIGASYMNTAPQAMNITDMRDNGIPNYTGNLSVSYELDLFGKNAAKQLSAKEQLFETEYKKDALKLVLMSDVALNYFTALSLQKRLQLANENLAASHDLLEVVKARLATGASTQLDINRAESELAKAKAAITQLEENKALAQNALAVLTATPPQSFTLNAASFDKLLIPQLALVQPAELLERRPDLKAAEARIKAYNADIEAAKAAFYPSVTISPSLLLAASPSAAALSLLSSIYAPLFTGGELEGQLDKVTAAHKEAAHNYKQTVLNAFKEAQNALISAQKTSERETQLQVAANSAAKAYKLGKNQYELSVIEFTEVLELNKNLIQLKDTQTKARLNTLKARIALFKAMGGGWRNN